MTKHSLNFRSTAGSWAETGSDGAILGDAYPVVRGGLTCGWSIAVTKTDYVYASNARLSGRNNINTGAYFRVDLPLGPGTYRIWLAVGAINTTAPTAFIIRDGAGSVIASTASTSVGGGVLASANVMDASGAVIPYATYISTGGTYVEFTATSSYIQIARTAGVTLYLANIQLEPQTTPLVDAVLSTEFGTGTHTGSILPKQPAQHGIGKVSSSSGTQAFTLTAGGTYFALETRSGATWLVTTSTRIPDAWTGSVTVRQTSDGATHDTTFSLTASTVSRPVTGELGRITTETYLKRKEILDVVDGELWAGYTGQAFVSDQTSNSYTDLVSKINALTPNGTGWYRIRLQNGTWTGNALNLSQKDFGTGGLLIEPDTGHDPAINCEFRYCALRKCHVRGLRIVPRGANNGYYNFTCTIPSSAPYPLWKFTGNRIGAYYADTAFSTADWVTWADFAGFEFVEQIDVSDNAVNGILNLATISGGRIMNFRRNNCQNVAMDFHALTTAFRFNTPRGVFADNYTYAVIQDVTAWNNPDVYTGLITGVTPHGDMLQVRRTTGGTYAYPTTSAGLNGSSSVPWVVGYVGFNPTINKLYTVTAITGDALLDPLNQPTGTGTGIISGNLTFDYLQDYTLGTTLKVLMERICSMQSGDTINGPGNATPNNQFVINSNSEWNNILEVVAINNIPASSNSRGIDAGDTDGDVWAEYNSFVGGATKALDNDQALVKGRNLRLRGNITGVVSDLPYTTGSVSKTEELAKPVNWQNSAVTPFLPAEHLKGPFTKYISTGWGYPFTDDGTQTPAQIQSALSKTLHHLTGAAGARLTEKHTITVTDSLGATVTLTLDVAP